MKIKNRLLNYKYFIYQDDEWFKFSLDSVLLANFVTINLRCKNIIDLACGNAVIPMLVSLRTKAHIEGIEFQKCVYDLGVLSVSENNLSSQISLKCGDVKDINKYYSSDSFDTVTCNPPYFNTDPSKFVNDNSVKSLARHEINLSLDDVLKASYYLLKNGGNIAMVHRTGRLIEIIEKLKKYNFEPKRMQFIYPKDNKNSDLFLIEATKNGNVGLKLLPNLVIHNEDGSYKDNIRRYFE